MPQVLLCHLEKFYIHQDFIQFCSFNAENRLLSCDLGAFSRRANTGHMERFYFF